MTAGAAQLAPWPKALTVKPVQDKQARCEVLGVTGKVLEKTSKMTYVHLDVAPKGGAARRFWFDSRLVKVVK